MASDNVLANKLLVDSYSFLILLKKAAACRIEGVSQQNVQQGFAWAHSIYEKCLVIEEEDQTWLKQGKPFTGTLKHHINDKLTALNSVAVKLPCCINFEFMKRALDFLVEALLMNVTLQPAAVDEVLRLCNVDPYKKLVKTRMACWDVCCHYRQCQTAVYKVLQDILDLLSTCDNDSGSSQISPKDSAPFTASSSDYKPSSASSKQFVDEELGRQDVKGGKDQVSRSQSSSPSVLQTVDGLDHLEMRKVVSFVEKVVDWHDAAQGLGWFLHFQLPGLLKIMGWSVHGKSLMVACMCINRAHIEISKRSVVTMLQTRMLDQLKYVFAEISQKDPSEKWYWLKELQEEVCAKAAEEFPAFEKWYTSSLETCVNEFDNNQYLPTLGAISPSFPSADNDFTREVSWRFFYLLQRNTEMRQKVGSILMMGQNSGGRDRPTIWTKIYRRLARMMDQF